MADRDITKIVEDIDALQTRAAAAVEAAEGDSAKIEGAKALIETEIQPQLATLTAERDERLRDEEVKALRSNLTDLNSVIEELRKPSGDFSIGNTDADEGKALAEQPYQNGEASYYNDIRLANRGRTEALQRLKDNAYVGGKSATVFDAEGKAMSEGVQAQGGYLVVKDTERQIVEAVEQDNKLRALCSSININTSGIELNNIGLGTTAGWVAELAVKPEATSMTLATITANVFTAAGLATISNQLLADSNPAVDGLVTRDLSKRLVALEETAFLVGTGTGQPTGLLNTPGLQAVTLTEPGVTTTGGLLDAILDAISQVQAEHDQPTAIVLHPRTWTRILKDKDAQGHYILGPPGVAEARTASQFIFGVPVVLSNRVPTNLGAGANESRVIVGDYTEALILDRQGITVDESPHVLFTSNQTVFRAEKRVGFTAARTPKAFSVIGGAGLAGG